MNVELFIPGRMPGLNDIIAWRAMKKTYALYSRTKREWSDVIGLLVSTARTPAFPSGAYVSIIAREPNMRRDPDNVCAGASKFVLDALKKSGVLVNDGWKGVLGLRYSWEVDKRAPGVLVRLSTEAPQ